MGKQYDLLGPEHLDLETLTSKEASRYALTGLLIEPGRVSASNGRVLMMVPTTKVDGDELPEGMKAFEPVTGRVSVDAGGLKKALAFAAKNGAIPMLRNVVASFDPADTVMEERHVEDGKKTKKVEVPIQKKVTLSATDLETSGTVKARINEGDCPNVDAAVPRPETKYQVAIDARLLKLAAAYVERHGKEVHERAGFSCVPIAFTFDAKNPECGILGAFDLEDGRVGTLCLMPIKVVKT
jgi:hypothetical protein